jgi:hypothetical protein
MCFTMWQPAFGEKFTAAGDSFKAAGIFHRGELRRTAAESAEECDGGVDGG